MKMRGKQLRNFQRRANEAEGNPGEWDFLKDR